MSERIAALSVILLFLCASIASAAQTGMLYVKSDPAGAIVLVDGERCGTTPAFIRNVKPGDRVVELRLPGGQVRRELVTVEAGKIAKLNVRVSQEPASLTVISDPLEAIVSVDRRGRGTTPVTVERLEPVPHEVIVYKEGYEKVVRSVELQPGEARVLDVTLRPKGGGPSREGKKPAELAGMDEAGERLARTLEMFQELIGDGDYAGARELAERNAGRRALADVAPRLRAAARVAKALESRQKAVRRGAEGMVGKKVTLRTKAGPRKGKIDEVTEAGITLATEIRAGGRVVGSTTFMVAWGNLAPGQEDVLAKGWDRESPDGRIALAFLALARRDLVAAGRAVHGAVDHPLADYVRGTIDAVKRAPSEAAARKAWEEIERLARAPNLSAAGARKLLVKLDSFEKKYGQTDHAASMKARIAGAREAARQAFAKAAGAPPDAVEFNRHWYKLFDRRMTWREAKSFCDEQGGYLVTVTSREEQGFIERLADQGVGSVWIGLTNEGKRRFEWVTGEKVTCENWSPNEPHNLTGQQFFVRLWPERGWRWDDIDNDEQNRVICEWEPSAAAPSTSSVPPS